MHRLARFVILVLILASIIFPLQPAAAAPGRQPATARLNSKMQRIVELVNIRRAEAGIAAVAVDPVLMSCAQQYSETVAAMGKLSHTSPDGSTPGQRLRRCGYNWRNFGENLAAGYADADQLVAAWMASPSHRKIILNPKVREIGLGYTNRASDPNYYYDYYVMETGTRR